MVTVPLANGSGDGGYKFMVLGGMVYGTVGTNVVVVVVVAVGCMVTVGTWVNDVAFFVVVVGG